MTVLTASRLLPGIPHLEKEAGVRGMAARCRRGAAWIPVVAALSLTSVAHAGPGVWTTGGPFGGSIWALAIDPATPTTLYAGTGGGGVFKSTDAGAAWTVVNRGMPDPMVVALAIDPANPATLYAGGDGVFKCTDAGATWAETGLKYEWVLSLAIDPWTPSTLYAGTDGAIFRSTDSAATWTLVNTGLGGYPAVHSLVIDPRTPTTLYAGTEDNGVFRSTDSGGHWTAINDGLPGESYWGLVRSLVVDPKTPTTLYLGTNYYGVFKSTDSGGHWTPANVGLGPYPIIAALAIDPTTPATLYASAYGHGVYKSVDAGGTWTPARTGLGDRIVGALAVSAATPSTLYAGTYSRGVYKSADAGGTWAAASRGLATLYVTALANDPTTPSTLYAGVWPGGIYKSTDSGAAWAPAAGGPMGLDVAVLAVDPLTPTTLYAGTWFDGVLRSTDGGANWSDASTGLTNRNVLALAIDPLTPTTLYAGTEQEGAFKSTDSGSTWRAANTGLTTLAVYELAVDPSTPTTIYAGTGGGGIFKSVDAGGSWAEVNAGLTNPWVYDLTFDPANPATLYAGTYGGVFRTTDGGRTWTGAITDRIVYALAVDPASPATLYAGTWNGGVLRSTDGGGTWTGANRGLPYQQVNALALDPGAGTLYAGTADGSVWQSTPPAGGACDLAIRLSDSPDPVTGATPLTYTLRVTNAGPDLASSASVSHTLPAGVDFDHAYWARCHEAGNVVTCSLLGLAVGASADILVQVTPGPFAATLVSSAMVSATEADPNPADNSDSEDTTVTTPPVWTGTRTKTVLADSGEFVVNGSVTYTISLTSGGADTQADNPGHELVDVLLASLALVSAAATSGTVVSDLPTNTVTWDGSLPSGGSVTVTIRATIGPKVALGTVISNQALVHYDFDGDGINEATTLTDDPAVPGASDPTSFVVVSPTMDYYTLAPCRLVDTRWATGTFGGPALVAGADRVFPLFGQCDVPPTARALSVNLTVTQASAPGHLGLYAAGSPVPLSSSLSYSAGQTRAGNAVATLNGLGELAVRCSQASGTAHFILDVNGYFE